MGGFGRAPYFEKEDEGFEFGEVSIEHRTEKAVLVRDVDGTTLDQHDTVWIPVSQIHHSSEITRDDDIGDEGALIIKEWFAKKQEWLDE